MLVIHDDAVTVTVNYLTTALADYTDEDYGRAVRVGEALEGSVPYVGVRRDGGVQTRYLDRARISVQVWHQSDTLARALTALVRGLVLDMPGTGNVRAVREVGGPNYVYDRQANRPRYLFTVEMTVRP